MAFLLSARSLQRLTIRSGHGTRVVSHRRELSDVSRMGQDSQSKSDVERVANSEQRAIGFIALNELQEICRVDPSRARPFYEKAKKAGHLKPSRTALRALISALQRIGDTEGVREVLVEGADAGLKADEMSNAAFLTASAGRQAELQEAIATIGSSGSPFTARHVELVVSSLLSKREFKQALEVFDKAKEQLGVLPASLYSRLIYALGRHHPERVLALFRESRALQQPPNVFIMIGVVQALVEQKLLDEALKVFTTLRETVQPNTKAFNALAPVYAARGPFGIFDLFRDLAAAGVQPDRFTFNLAMEELLKQNEADKALQLLPIIVRTDQSQLPSPPQDRAGLEVDAFSFSSLITHFVARADKKGIETVVAEMQRRGVRPSTATRALLAESGATMLPTVSSSNQKNQFRNVVQYFL